MNKRDELTTYQHIDRMARETALLAMELARFCLTSHSLQTSERELAVRVRDLCYTLLGTKHHKALPDANIEAEFPEIRLASPPVAGTTREEM